MNCVKLPENRSVIIWASVAALLFFFCPFLSGHAQPTGSLTVEEVGGFWSVGLRTHLKVEGRFAHHRGNWESKEQTTGFFEFNPGTLGFDLRADNWRTDQLLFGKFSLSRKGDKVFLNLDPAVTEVVEGVLRPWVAQLAASHNMAIDNTEFIFHRHNEMEGLKNRRSTSCGLLPAWEASFMGFVTGSVNGHYTRMPFTLEILMSCGSKFVPGSRGAANLPPGISPLNVTLQPPGGSFTLNPDGTFTMDTLLPDPFLVAATEGGVPVAISFFDPGKSSNSISCLETAVSLAMLSNMLFTVPSPLIPEALALIRTVPEVKALGGVICQELSERPDALTVPGPDLIEALSEAAQAVDAVLKALVAEPLAFSQGGMSR